MELDKMNLFTNGVGRPSNETIKKRNIFKGICALLVLVIIGLVGYILNDKGIINLINKKASNDNENIITTTESTKEKTTTDSKNAFDVSKVVTKDAGDNGITDNSVEIYVYGHKVNYEYAFESLVKVTPIEDIALIELSSIDNGVLLLVNQKGEIIHNFGKNENMYYMGVNEVYCKDCYGYKVNGNKITAVITDLGQDVEYTICKNNYSKPVFKEVEVTYENGKVASKELMSLTGKEYIEKNNINCTD